MVKLRVLVLIAVLMLVAVPAFAQDGALIGLGSSDDLGEFLIGPDGMTLYMFTRDPLDSSVCVDQCAENWPPLTVESADEITVADGISGEFSTVEREDGNLQVAYNGMPLYYWFNDVEVGETTGQGVGNVWFVVPPATVYAFAHGDVPAVLVGPTGMTLYTFANDEMGVSNCDDACAGSWPPLTVASADELVLGVNLFGELDTTERADGTLQVTYDGMPLYYWAGDAAHGDMNGEGIGDVWFTEPAETIAASSSDELGEYLIGWNGMTLYIFTNDAEGVSNCDDSCAANWPPLTVSETAKLKAAYGIMGELGTTERADGTLQVTYNGMPLYFWQGDKVSGDATGQGIGDVWFVVAP